MIQIKNKMNHTEAIQEIIKVAPESKEEFQEVYKTKNSFMVINVFTKHIKNLIGKGDIKILLKSLNKMNELYKKGTISKGCHRKCLYLFSRQSNILLY